MRAMTYEASVVGEAPAGEWPGGVSADWMYKLAAAVAAFVLLLPML